MEYQEAFCSILTNYTDHRIQTGNIQHLSGPLSSTFLALRIQASRSHPAIAFAKRPSLASMESSLPAQLLLADSFHPSPQARCCLVVPLETASKAWSYCSHRTGSLNSGFQSCLQPCVFPASCASFSKEIALQSIISRGPPPRQ